MLSNPLSMKIDFPPVQAVVFDFDGTLASLEIDFGFMRTTIIDLAASFGLSPDQFDGRYVLEGISVAAGWLGRSNDGAAREFIRQALSAIENIELAAAEKGLVFPETRPALTALNRSGYKLGVITRNCRAALDRVFPDLAGFVAVIMPRDVVDKVKPDPRHLLAALEVLDVPPGKVLMVGDHPIDIHTGHAVGAFTAGVGSGRHSRADLLAAGADLAFDHIGQLAAAATGCADFGPGYPRVN